jgi:hypothetical protein
VNGSAHFIDLGGNWHTAQYDRAVETARVHSEEVIVHRLQPPQWLRTHPIGLANVKDFYAYGILYDFGGIVLDFDTISLRPAWDLLTADVCMSTEFPPGQEAGALYNTAVILGRQGAPILRELQLEAMRLLAERESIWGALGPHLITRVAKRSPEHFSPAPYRALNGWSYHAIGDYYANPRDPGEDVRVIHLYSSDHQAEFRADTWAPTT